MQDQNPTYDLSISFLYQDIALAQALYDELSKNLKVFFSPRNQEELAGSDGLESMREPFRSQSRLNLVLYRPRWGKTPWTGVEEVAVKESCLATSFKSIFFFLIEPTLDIPMWLPETHVRFNYADFTLDQAIGAIKARVQERGGHFIPMTSARKVQLLQAEEEYQRARRQMSSENGMQKIQENVKLLFDEAVSQIEDVNASGHLNINHQVRIQPGQMEQFCMLGAQQLSMSIIWFQHYSNGLDGAFLVVQEFNQNVIPPGHMLLQNPEAISETKYVPDLARTREYIWIPQKANGKMVSSKDLASELVLQFLDLIERDRAGKVKRKLWR